MRDLRFRALGVPVTVEPWFWVMSLLLGAFLNPRVLPAWMLVVFVSVLVHELGHAMVGRSYGLTPEIRLYAFGGLTASRGRRLTPWRGIWLSLAGPGAGFALCALFLLLRGLGPEAWVRHPFLGPLLSFGVFVNLWWGLLNLLPVLPLDGGSVMRSLVQLYVLRPASELPFQISVAVAAVVATLGFVSNQMVLSILFGWMAYTNYTDLQRAQRFRSR